MLLWQGAPRVLERAPDPAPQVQGGGAVWLLGSLGDGSARGGRAGRQLGGRHGRELLLGGHLGKGCKLCSGQENIICFVTLSSGTSACILGSESFLSAAVFLMTEVGVKERGEELA